MAGVRNAQKESGSQMKDIDVSKYGKRAKEVEKVGKLEELGKDVVKNVAKIA